MGLSLVGAVVVVHIHGLCNQHEVWSVYMSSMYVSTSMLPDFETSMVPVHRVGA
jgi:hypothetical protein